MKKIKQLNKWIIKAKTEGELTKRYNRELDNRYSVFAPDGRHMEENLTLEQAENFCKDNLDFIKS